MTLFDDYPDLKQLNDYSKSVAEDVYVDYPQWMKFATCEDGNLIITIQSPQAPTERQLIIDTHRDEITVSFAPFYHSHFDCWACEPNDYFNFAKGVVEALINEEKIVYWKVQDGFTRYIGTVQQDKIDDLEVEWTHMASWLGTFDRENNTSEN